MSVERRWTDAKQRIKDSLSIVAVVESYLPLRRAGRNYKARCPFHEEKTPSFHVFPETDTFKCFGCGKGGDIFTFVQESERVGFREAMEMLAARAGVSLESAPPGQVSRSSSLRSVMEMATEFYAACLRSPAGQAAREYLDRRHLTAAVEPFALGWAPESWTALVEHARGLGLEPGLLAEAGLAREGRQGLHDYFHGRLMIPIRDPLGRVVAFGARVLDNSEPKYLNSPDTPLFTKRKLLFGLDRARRAKADDLLVVEGYTDMMAASLAGVEGVVAGLGTALTEDHGRLLERYCRGRVTLLYDGDRAGWQAAEKAVGELAGTGLDLHVSLLEEGRDPADLVEAGGGQALIEAAAAATPAFRVKLDLVARRYDLADPTATARAAGELVDYLVRIDDPVKVERLTREGAARLRVVRPDALARAVARARGGRRRPGVREREEQAPPARPVPAAGVQAQERVLEAVLHNPALLDEVDPELITEARCRRVLDLIYRLVESMDSRGAFPWDLLLDGVRDDQDLLDRLTGWRNHPTPVKNRALWLKQCLLALKCMKTDREAATLDEAIRRARAEGRDEDVLDLRRQRNRLNRQRVDQEKQLQGMEE